MAHFRSPQQPTFFTAWPKRLICFMKKGWIMCLNGMTGTPPQRARPCRHGVL